MHHSIKRRMFFKMSALAGAASVLPAVAKPTGQTSSKAILKPKRLEKGMTIGLIAPASNASEDEDIRYAMDIIRSLGFKVKPGQHLFHRSQYLAGSDRDRAADVNAAFADSEVDAIICLRGGYGSARILPFLKYDLIRANPKVFLGYSDITAMHSAIQSKTGLITFHGPIAKQSFSEYTLAEFKKILFEAADQVEIGAPPPFDGREGLVEKNNRITSFYPGKARGHLIGGNLSLINNIMGSPYAPDFKGAILVLEDVNEEPYRIDGMLTHLWLAGKLQELQGIIFGKFTDCESEGGNSFSLEQLFRQRCDALKIPAYRGLMVGHVDDQTVLPIGAMAEMDADRGRLKLVESVVS